VLPTRHPALLARRALVLDCLEVRRQTPSQPHQLDISVRFALEPTARLDAFEVAVNVELEQHCRMVGRSTRLRRLRPLEPQFAQVEFIDKRVDNTNRVGFVHVIVQQFGQQGSLPSVFALDKALHRAPVLMRYWLNVYPTGSVYTIAEFLHSLGREQTCLHRPSPLKRRQPGMTTYA
jgi:hypothetical protein